jgi:hypothetical protein
MADLNELVPCHTTVYHVTQCCWFRTYSESDPAGYLHGDVEKALMQKDHDMIDCFRYGGGPRMIVIRKEGNIWVDHEPDTEGQEEETPVQRD